MQKKYFSRLRSADVVTIAFLSVLSVVEIVRFVRLLDFLYYIPINIVIIFCILYVSHYVFTHDKDKNSFIKFLFTWYLVPAVLYSYTQASSITHSLHGRDYDATLIAIDQWLFGVNPTQWISQFANPILTEILQISYSSYYLFFIVLFYELYRKKKIHEFEEGALLIVFGFYLSYIGYLLVPAIGPRFTLHEFQSIESELPGLWITSFLRHAINSGGGVIDGINPVLHVHRDVFPSGHTQLTLAAMYIAFTSRSTIRWGLLVIGSLLIVATVYMRYHYGIDVIAGIIFFFLTIWLGKIIHRWWLQRLLPNISLR